jgi:uncharacterized membrane protein YcaP (DUF421 family)
MDWFQISLEQTLGIMASVVFIYFALLIIVRLNGLRSFSKMSSHDFAVTVAIGSIVATCVVAQTPTMMQAVVAIGSLLAVQSVFSKWRVARQKARLETNPLLLMDGAEILHENLKEAKLTENDLIAKLREANVLDMSEVKAAVFEATGDVSIMHGDKDIQPQLMRDVRRKA